MEREIKNGLEVKKMIMHTHFTKGLHL